MAYNQLKSIFIGNTSMDDTEVDEMLSKETFLNPEKGMKAGLFDSILPSGNDRIPAISAEMNAEELMNVFNQGESPQIDKMKNVNSLLGLEAEAVEKSTIEAVTKLQAEVSKIETIEAKNETLVSEIATLKASLKEANTAKAVDMISNAIKAGKVKEAQKAVWEKNAVSDFEGTKAMLEGINGAVASKSIMNDEIITGTEGTENRSVWGFEEWSKNDPKGLEKLRVENNAKFEKMLDEYVG